MTIGSEMQHSYGGGDKRGGLGSSESGKIDRPTPRSLLNWINSSNTKRVQQRITNRIQYLKQMSQNRLGGNGPATIGHEQPSTAFESQNDKTTSAGGQTKGNSSYRPISAYPMSSGIRRSQEKKGTESEYMSQTVKGGGVKLIHHSQMNYPPFDSANTRVSGGGYSEGGRRREDIVFDDKYIISENTIM
jgi:hypothetical protein